MLLEQNINNNKMLSGVGSRKNVGLRNYQSGLIGEQVVIDYFIRRGYSLIVQRQKTSFGEIDLIFDASVDGCKKLVFVEVKGRKARGVTNKFNNNNEGPFAGVVGSEFCYDDQSFYNVVSAKQIERIFQSIEIFAQEHCGPEYALQLDLIIIEMPNMNIRHIENVLRNDIE